MKKGIQLISLCESMVRQFFENTSLFLNYVCCISQDPPNKYVCVLHKISAFQLCFTSRVVLR